MKDVFKIIGVIALICFSFFYTDKVITVINEQDPLMIKIEDVKNEYYIKPINAYIEKNTVIPGINGKKVNVDNSYKKMREIGAFTPIYLEYDLVVPTLSVKDNKNKFIVKGNSNKQSVAIIFTIINDTNLDKLLTILKENNIKVAFFLDYDFLNKNINDLRKNLLNYDIYSLGNNFLYTPDILIFSNNLINRTFDNQTIYCLSNNFNIKTLNVCLNNDNYTINVELSDYNKVKNNLESGNIIYLNTDTKTMMELDTIIKFIKSKGLNIVSLEELLSE